MRANQVQIRQRVSEVMDLLALDYDRPSIINYVERAGWGISIQQVDKYIGKARRKLENIVQEPTADSLNRSVLQLLAVYKKAMSQDKLGVALAARKELNKLRDLYSATDEKPTPEVDEEYDISGELEALDLKNA